METIENISENILLPPGYILKGIDRNYRIEQLTNNKHYLGIGGFAITYKSSFTTLLKGNLGTIESKIYVAIKEVFIQNTCLRKKGTYEVYTLPGKSEIFDTIKKRLIKEANIISSCKHPNIVNVLEIFEANNTAYMVMEFIEGLSLKDWVLNNPEIDPRLIEYIVYQIISGVEYIHSKNILHLDIKPNNILITSDYKVKVIDFGLSKVFDDNQLNAEATQTFLGFTRNYAAIEQYSSDSYSKIGKWTDIYSIGCIIYFLINRKDPKESVARVIEDDPLLKINNPNTLQKIMLKCMEINKDDRYQSLSEPKQLLEKNLKNFSLHSYLKPHSNPVSFSNSLSSDEDNTPTLSIDEQSLQKIIRKTDRSASKIQQQFQSLMQNADDCILKKKWELALEYLNRALELNVDNENVKKKIDKVNKLIEEEQYLIQRQNEEKVNKLINNAYTHIEKKEWQEALNLLREALKFNLKSEFINSKINQIQKSIIEEKKQQEFEKIVSLADDMFQAGKWKKAKELYEKSLQYQLRQDYIHNQIRLIQENLGSIQKEKKTLYLKVIIPTALFLLVSIIVYRFFSKSTDKEVKQNIVNADKPYTFHLVADTTLPYIMFDLCFSENNSFTGIGLKNNDTFAIFKFDSSLKKFSDPITINTEPVKIVYRKLPLWNYFLLNFNAVSAENYTSEFVMFNDNFVVTKTVPVLDEGNHLANDFILMPDNNYFVACGLTMKEQQQYAFITKKDPRNNRTDWTFLYNIPQSVLYKIIYVEKDSAFYAVGKISQGNKSVALILKLDSKGQILWDKTHGGSDEDEFVDLISINDNKIDIIGGEGGWFISLDKQGNRLVEHVYGYKQSIRYSRICPTFDNNLIIGGYTIRPSHDNQPLKYPFVYLCNENGTIIAKYDFDFQGVIYKILPLDKKKKLFIISGKKIINNTNRGFLAILSIQP
ncbi:MAG: hypothetical protein KatS3mg028_1667 [Bacteroidia bacterium]|nr:MAG: hypothetical protein KatS3mg028_1667 [Bacteroidia bacterium]